MEKSTEQAEWFLEGYLDSRKTLRRWMIGSLPYRVGRHPDLDLCLPFNSVSSQHAEFYSADDSLGIRDLNSTNGTFVNRKRIQEDALLQEGDVLHFSEYEFRVGRLEAEPADASHTIYTDLSETNLPEKMAMGVREFKQMLLNQAVLTLFQPIVELATEKSILGFEALGRGNQAGLVTTPIQLFHIAASLGLEAELSALFRLRGVEVAKEFKGSPKIFVNTHPNELEYPKFWDSMETLRQRAPLMDIILEIHEGAVTDLQQMRELHSQLAKLKIGLAYDDFGAGQARLLELVEVPPDYLKFDVSLIRDIDKAPASKQKMMESLVRMGQEIGVLCLAEGIEREEEERVCREMGFPLAQGFLFGKPGPVSDWR